MTEIDYGPLAQFIADENIHNIYVNDPRHIYIWHKWDGYKAADVSFKDADELAKFAHVLVSSVGQSVSVNSPIREIRLPDGSHATVIVAPVATQGAIIRISKPVDEAFTMEKLVQLGAASAGAAAFLTASVKARLNIAVVGGFNSGKETYLNVLLNEVYEHARVAVIQPISTLSIKHADAVVMETRKADINGQGAITNRQLLEHTLDMQPGRIILPELDGTESDLLLTTMDLGYSTMFAMRASGARDALARLESSAVKANLSTPLLSIREQLARTLDLIVHVELFELGEIALKRIIGIWELRGMKGDTIEVVQLFERPRDRDELLALGVIPQVLEKIRKLNRSEIDENWFKA